MFWHDSIYQTLFNTTSDNFVVSIGQFCVQAIRGIEREECGRYVGTKEGPCTSSYHTSADLNTEDYLLDGDSQVRYPWQHFVNTKEISSSSEKQKKTLIEAFSSEYIDSAHGEYDLTRGHFICQDPYEAFKETLASKQSDPFKKSYLQGFATMPGLKAIIYHLNFYDVQARIYN